MDVRLRRRFRIIVFLIAITFSVFIIRIINLMFFHKEHISSLPDTPEYMERGLIVDRNGDKLALSLETYSVYVRPEEIEQKSNTAKKLASILEIEYGNILIF